MPAPTANFAKLLNRLRAPTGSLGDRLVSAQAGEILEFTSNISCPTEKTRHGGEPVGDAPDRLLANRVLTFKHLLRATMWLFRLEIFWADPLDPLAAAAVASAVGQGAVGPSGVADPA